MSRLEHFAGSIKLAQYSNRLCLDMLNKTYHYALLSVILKVHKFN